MAVEFRCATARGRRYANRLRADARDLMVAAELPDCELSLSLVSDRAIRTLNRNYRGIDSATDVLSFSQIEQAGVAPADPHIVTNDPALTLGDVVISIDTALAQARDLRTQPAARIRRLLIHGFLHLLGYDHERSSAEARKMFARERALEDKISNPRSSSTRRKTVARRKVSRRRKSV
ncbi:MAG TPA: rRNA maturation RNase YbeY [Candidatus Dormibacteraeota bacterium]|nr:rRNA maturation RNase YbeY [Candidatus Dormibacteraeota bacterium]